MTPQALLTRCAAAALLALVGAAAWPAGPAWAQSSGASSGATDQASDADAEDDGGDEASEEVRLSDEELDDLTAPIALYPDALLAQILVASTFPLDIVKANRWVEDNEELDDKARADAAEEQDWDPSIIALAAGFPTVLAQMAEDLDWTQDLGDALILQSDDVLDSLQRMRARAAAVGNLTDNVAQTVRTEDDAIYIEPKDPEVVYVPKYDDETVYVSRNDSPPVIVENNDDYSSGDLLATGVISFGAGMLVNEIFDDDDHWGGYWRPGPPYFGWNGGAVYPRPCCRGGVNIGNDVNIGGRNNNFRGRNDIRANGAWKPDRDPRRRHDAERRIDDRRRDGNLGRQASRGDRPRNASLDRQRSGGERQDLRNKINKRSGSDVAGRSAAKKLDRPKGGGKPDLKNASRNGKVGDRNRNPAGGGAFAKKGGLGDARKATNRGASSAAKAKLPKGKGGGVAQKARAKPKIAQRPPAGGGIKKASALKSGGASRPKASAFSKGGGGRPKMGGGRSGGGMKRGGGGGRKRR